MHAAAAVRGMTWNDGVISWGLRPLHLADLHLFSPVSHSIQVGMLSRSFSTAELRDRGGNFACTGPWTWGETCDVQLVALELTKVVRGTWAQSMLSFLHFHPGDREERECWYHGYTRTVLLKHLAFSCLHNDDLNLGLGPNKDPLKNRLKVVAAIEVRNPIRTHTDSHPPKGQVGHLWILSETS